MTESKLPKKIFFNPLFNRFLTFTRNYVAALMYGVLSIIYDKELGGKEKSVPGRLLISCTH